MILTHPVVVKPYLLKYMSHYVKVQPEFTISEKNRFGLFLINCLKHKKYIVQHDYKVKMHGVKLMVVIPAHYEKNYGIHISKKCQFRFNSFLLDEFNDRMLDFVVPRLNGKKGDVKQSLLAFRSIYGICEDDLPYKTLEKQWERAHYCAITQKTA